MSLYSQRGQAFESKFAYDGESGFCIKSKQSKLYGEWAADKLGLNQHEKQCYIEKLMSANIGCVRHEDLMKIVGEDLKAQGIEISDHMIEVAYHKTMGTAQTEYLN